uniref:Uncharacterized protein n=1 Tax=Anopheles coluzzii TaxID=1518534 RepID=A0A6E8VH96_ANOCL|nr:uncharacterized protein LOC120947899 [Anopheles coluzzii]
MASNSLVNQSADDGIPLDFLAEMHVAMDCLPVDEAEAERLLNERKHKQQQARERVQRFNDAWSIQPIPAVNATPRITVANNLGINGRQEFSNLRDPRLVAKAKTIGSLPLDIIQQPVPHASGINNRQQQPHHYHHQQDTVVPLQRDEVYQHNVPAVVKPLEHRGVSYSDNEEDDVILLPQEHEELHRAARGRSRSPGSRNPRSRDTSRTRVRGGHRSRRHSRSQSRSPTHRRRRRPTRSRSRHRSRSYSRSRSSSRSSEHSNGTQDSRGRSSSRRNRQQGGSDQTVMMQSMMSMVMQMVNNGILMGASNRAQVPAGCGPAATPVAVDPGATPQLTPAAFRNMFANRHCSDRGGQFPDEVVNLTDSCSSTVVEQSEDTRPKYDVSTELFLEGKLSFADFLALKPSARSDLIVPIDPQVPKRINEAISILDQQDTKKHSTRFLYVPPTYYDSEKKEEHLHHRSPLAWNSQNVLFESTTRSREVKQCQPFSNLNLKLKELIVKLGLDEGLVSQQLEQVKLAASLQKNDGDNGNRSAVGASTSSASIQAITVLPPKPGTGKVRHLIDREAQTDGYACIECVARKAKTIITTSTQTAAAAPRKDMEVQTNGPPLSAPNVLSLDGLNANQIETIEAIVRFVRTRQLAGSIESVQHALRNDRVTAAGMTPTVQQNAQRLLSQVKADLQRSGTFPGSSHGSSSSSNINHNHNHNSIAQYQGYQQPPLPAQPVSHLYEQQLRDLRMGHRRGSGITRTFHTTSVSEQIFPACYDSHPPMSKKSKKKGKQLHHYNQHGSW